MYSFSASPCFGKESLMTDYSTLLEQIRAFAETDSHPIPLLSNVSALLKNSMEDVSWAGFYLFRNGRLVLGPFQGKPACTHIEYGKGVCGTAIAEKVTQVVPDVHAYPGYIDCDCAAESEIVVPMFRIVRSVNHCEVPETAGGMNRIRYGVLDLDSPVPARFTEADREGLEAIVRLLESVIQY